MYKKLISEIAKYSDRQYPFCFLDYEIVGCRDSTETNREAYCICGERIRWEYIIKNKADNRQFIVGSVCIESIVRIIDKDTPAEVLSAIYDLIKQMKKANASKTHKYCQRCKKTRIYNYNYRDELQTMFCKQCYDPRLHKFVCKANIAPDCWQYTYNNEKLKYGGYPDKCGRCWKVLSLKKSGFKPAH